jgi:hypothetical protein
MVNTFLPFANFKKCAKSLDNKRLGKQRVEAKQIINILTNSTETKGWKNHPAVLMWKGYEKALMMYYNEMVNEWILRGFKNNMTLYNVKSATMPWFIGIKTIHLSYQANLIRKDKNYKNIFTDVPSKYIKYTYVWPSKLNSEQISTLMANPTKILEIKDYTTIKK